MLGLSKNQTRILETIILKINKYGYPPSIREICDAVGLRSTATVHSHLNKLEKLGYIKRDPSKPRAIEVMSNDMNQDIPGLNQEIIELPVIEFLENEKELEETVTETIKLPSNFVIGKDNFLFKVKDNKLIQAGIFENDYVIVDRCNVVENASLIIGSINNRIILGRYFRNEEDFNIKFQDRSNDTVSLNKNTFEIIGKIKGNLRVIK